MPNRIVIVDGDKFSLIQKEVAVAREQLARISNLMDDFLHVAVSTPDDESMVGMRNTETVKSTHHHLDHI